MDIFSSSLRPFDPTARFNYLALALAIGAHLVLAVFLFFSAHFDKKPPAPMRAILVNASDLASITQTPIIPAPQPKPLPPKAQPKPLPKPELAPDIVLKDTLPPEPEPEPLPESVPKPKSKSEPKTADKPKVEAEEKTKLKAKDDKNLEKRFDDLLKTETRTLENKRLESMLSSELASLEGGRQSRTEQRELEAYKNQLRSKIKRNIVLPPALEGNPEAVFRVQQTPDGTVLAVYLERSSGSEVLDRAVSNAIMKSSPLPLPKNRDVFSRELLLNFKPLE